MRWKAPHRFKTIQIKHCRIQRRKLIIATNEIARPIPIHNEITSDFSRRKFASNRHANVTRASRVIDRLLDEVWHNWCRALHCGRRGRYANYLFGKEGRGPGALPGHCSWIVVFQDWIARCHREFDCVVGERWIIGRPIIECRQNGSGLCITATIKISIVMRDRGMWSYRILR